VWTGRVKEIYIAERASGPMLGRSEAAAVAGRGLEGDRYYAGEGFYSHHPGPVRELSLIEHEVLTQLGRAHNLPLPPGAHRRNLVTEGVPLGHLIGRRFRIGQAVAEGVEIAEPCRHLVEVTGERQILSALIHRGGLHAAVVTSGRIQLGDAIAPLDATAPGDR
jgi:MOSC domain-containing protein YiiM